MGQSQSILRASQVPDIQSQGEYGQATAPTPGQLHRGSWSWRAESSCGEEDGLSHDIHQLLLKTVAVPPTPVPSHNLHKEAMLLQLPRSRGGIRRWGQNEAESFRYSKALRRSPVGCLPALSQGAVVTGIGSKPIWA